MERGDGDWSFEKGRDDYYKGRGISACGSGDPGVRGSWRRGWMAARDEDMDPAARLALMEDAEGKISYGSLRDFLEDLIPETNRLYAERELPTRLKLLDGGGSEIGIEVRFHPGGKRLVKDQGHRLPGGTKWRKPDHVWINASCGTRSAGNTTWTSTGRTTNSSSGRAESCMWRRTERSGRESR